MDDIFIEQIIKKKKTVKSVVIIVGTVILAAVVSFSVLLVSQISIFFPFVLAASIWGALILIRYQNIEYEYSLTNGDLDVDKIIAKRKRVAVFSVEVKTMEIVAPMTEEYRREYESDRIARKVDAAPSDKSPGRWFAIFEDTQGLLTFFIFQPNERMLAGMKRYLHNKFKDGRAQ